MVSQFSCLKWRLMEENAMFDALLGIYSDSFWVSKCLCRKSIVFWCEKWTILLEDGKDDFWPNLKQINCYIIRMEWIASLIYQWLAISTLQTRFEDENHEPGKYKYIMSQLWIQASINRKNIVDHWIPFICFINHHLDKVDVNSKSSHGIRFNIRMCVGAVIRIFFFRKKIPWKLP